MISIDGSYGEGGGQILRTALGYSCIVGKPVHIYSIRRGRSKPGLAPQHLMCVHALAAITNASVAGDRKGSTELTFTPGMTKAGTYRFDIQTAGSTVLLLQAILPPLLYSRGGSRITALGGTHAAFSPTFEYFSQVFIPTLNRLGADIRTDIESWGFYPGGGGKVEMWLGPGKEIKSLTALERGTLRGVSGISAVANLPVSIATRQKHAALSVLRSAGIEADIDVRAVPSPVPGTYMFLRVEAENVRAGFSALGARGKRAETVGEEAAAACVEYCRADTCLDPHLADQIIPYLAMAVSESSFTTSRISGHLLTNLWVVKKFVPVSHTLYGAPDSPGQITLSPRTAWP